MNSTPDCEHPIHRLLIFYGYCKTLNTMVAILTISSLYSGCDKIPWQMRCKVERADWVTIPDYNSWSWRSQLITTHSTVKSRDQWMNVCILVFSWSSPLLQIRISFLRNGATQSRQVFLPQLIKIMPSRLTQSKQSFIETPPSWVILDCIKLTIKLATYYLQLSQVLSCYSTSISTINLFSSCEIGAQCLLWVIPLSSQT